MYSFGTAPFSGGFDSLGDAPLSGSRAALNAATIALNGISEISNAKLEGKLRARGGAAPSSGGLNWQNALEKAVSFGLGRLGSGGGGSNATKGFGMDTSLVATPSWSSSVPDYSNVFKGS